MTNNKKYQVFVSSTYEDLQEERKEVIQALLELDCIPSGMELFQAADEDQWSLIMKVIDDCDYYIVVIGGRYGSTRPDGISYTEMEYRYALDKGKPTLGFIYEHPDELPVNKSEETSQGKKALDNFRKLVQEKMCRHWTDAKDLGSKVSRSLIKLIKNQPGIGWIRANELPSEDTLKELLDLRRQVESLNDELEKTKVKPPEGTEELSHGNDRIRITYTFDGTDKEGTEWIMTRWFNPTWNELFSKISPLMIEEASDETLKHAIEKYIEENRYDKHQSEEIYRGRRLYNFKLKDDNFQTIKVQFKALGLMTKSSKPHSMKDISTYWTLTKYGDVIMTRLRAIKKSPIKEGK